MPEPTEEENQGITSVYSSVLTATSSSKFVSEARNRFNDALSRLCPIMYDDDVDHNKVGKGGIVNLRRWAPRAIPLRVLESIQYHLYHKVRLRLTKRG